MSVDAVVRAAIELADAAGLEAVSMARVATALGFTAMSLYRHVNSKDELLALMWNASAQGSEELVIEGDSWREKLRTWALIQRDMLDRHHWITQMPVAAPPLAPNSLTFVERGLQTLDDTGIADPDRLRVIGLLSSYTLSEARMAHDASRGRRGYLFESRSRLGAPGSSLVTSFGIGFADDDRPSVRNLVRRGLIALRGEPFKFRLAPEHSIGFLAETGWTVPLG